MSLITNDANNVHIIYYSVLVNFKSHLIHNKEMFNSEHEKIDFFMLTNIISCDHISGKLILCS